MHSAAILTIGSEVLDGRVQDTNSNFICKKLNKLGINVSHVLSCTDDINEIKELIDFALKNNNLIIISGGLGPTTDDLTREAVSEYFSRPLKLDNQALEDMKTLYAKRGRNFNPTNKKQALFPEESIIIKNSVGTAPGFMIDRQTSDKHLVLACLPGVPSELVSMYEETLEPYYLKNLGNIQPITIKGFKCFGMPEAQIGSIIQSLNLPESIFVSYRAAFPQVHVALKSYTEQIDEYYNKVMAAIGTENIFTTNLDLSFEEILLKLLEDRNLTISTAESCTGGMLSSLLTNIPGSSKSYLGSIVSYANKVKINTLGVDAKTIEQYGAVSKETALEMAINCRKKIGSDIALAITGIAGPDRGSSPKPVGLYYVGYADKDKSSVHQHFLPLKRKQIRTYSSAMAIDIARRHILNLAQIEDTKLPNEIINVK